MKNGLMMGVPISKDERDAFKALSREKGMLMGGYLAQLIRRELRENSELVPSVQSNHGYISHYKD